MYKFILLSLLITTNLFGCTLCSLFVPKVDVQTTIYPKENSTTLDIKWQFEKKFQQALGVYDVNGNGTYERPEREAIKEVVEDYIAPISYLTNIEYIPKDQEFSQTFIDKFAINYSRVTFSDEGAMIYEYNIDIPVALKKEHKLYLEYFDYGGNFDFIMKEPLVKNFEFDLTIQSQQTHAIIYFTTENIPNRLEPKQLNIQKNIDVDVKEEIPQKESKESKESSGFLKYLGQKLQETKDLIENNLMDIKENNSIDSYIWLLVFSFLYGILHAMGPGHGKTLVGSYFLAQNKSYLKALSISTMIGFVHTSSAFFLTLIVYYILGNLLSSMILDVEQMAIKISAVVIILIALYLLYQKLFTRKKPINFKDSSPAKPSFVKQTNNQPAHTNSLSCGCNGCQTQSTDIGVILAAGLIPCPGTVTIFIFTLGLGIIYVGFLSAIFMSIGMSLVIFITALISVKIRKTASTNNLLIKILEYGSVLFILMLGIILLII